MTMGCPESPHEYVPNMNSNDMGDCAKCGNSRGHVIHIQDTPSVDLEALARTLAGKSIKTATCDDCSTFDLSCTGKCRERREPVIKRGNEVFSTFEDFALTQALWRWQHRRPIKNDEEFDTAYTEALALHGWLRHYGHTVGNEVDVLRARLMKGLSVGLTITLLVTWSGIAYWYLITN